MTKFEYEVFPVEFGILERRELDDVALKKKLNEYGQKGWELVTTTNTFSNGALTQVFFLFKRKVED